MRVLISAELTSQAYVANLARYLKAGGADVKCSVSGFFEPSSDVDVLHVQWPEALCDWREPSTQDLEQVRSCLGRWRQLTRSVVVTRHNAIPHAHRGPRPRALSDLVLSAAGGIVHLGAASLSETSRLYSCPQVVIPQGNSPDAGLVARASARSALRIPHNAFVVLVFGAIRHLAEKQLILETYRRLSVFHRIFLVPRWGEATQPSWLRSPVARVRAHLLDRSARRELCVDDGLVPESRVGLFFGAADVVFIPRLDTLNSAVLPTAYSHARVVVGPRTGNLTEILAATGNVTYRPGDADSAAEAIAGASTMDLDALGRANRSYALQTWDWSWIAGRHLEFYAQVATGRLAS